MSTYDRRRVGWLVRSTRRKDGSLRNRPRVVYHRAYFSIRRQNTSNVDASSPLAWSKRPHLTCFALEISTFDVRLLLRVLVLRDAPAWLLLVRTPHPEHRRRARDLLSLSRSKPPSLSPISLASLSLALSLYLRTPHSAQAEFVGTVVGWNGGDSG